MIGRTNALAGGGALKVATGTARVEAVTVNGATSTGVHVTGLDFTPCAVVVGYLGSTLEQLNNPNAYRFIMDGDGNIYAPGGYNWPYASHPEYVEAFEGGFKIGNMVSGYSPAWVAIGI